MADEYNLKLQLSADDRNLRTALAASARNLRDFEKQVETSMRRSSKGSEQYAQSILKIEQAELRVERAQKAYNAALATGGAESLRAREAANQLAQAQLRVGEAARSTQTSSRGLASAFGPANVAMRTAQGLAFGLGFALVTSFTNAGKEAIQFETNMRNVTSLLTSSGYSAQQLEAQYRGLSQGVLEISTQLPQSVTQLSEGLYEVVSAGVPAERSLSVLEASAKAASAGLTDTGTSANAIVGVMNAYGASAGSAAQVSDVLFQTVNAGVISFGALAQNLGDVVGMAAAAKVPIQDVGSAIAAMTRAGIVPAESTTSLNRLINEIIQPSENLARVYKTLGIESGQAALQQFGLYGTMEKLRAATGGSAEATLSLFNDIRAARGAFALMSNDGQTYAATQQAIGDANNRVGATERALSEQRKSLAYQWKLLVNNFQAGAIAFEQDIEPALRVVIGGMSEMAKFISENIHVVEALGVVVGVRMAQRFGVGRVAVDLYTASIGRMTAASVASSAASAGGLGRATLAASGLGRAGAAALGLFGGPYGIAATAAILGITFAIDQARKKQESFYKTIEKRYDLGSQDGLQKAIDETERKLSEAKAAHDRLNESVRSTDPRSLARASQEQSKSTKDLETTLSKLKDTQEQLKVSSGGAAAGIAQLSNQADSAIASVKAFEDATKDLAQEFMNWATPTTAFQSALSDAQEALQASQAATRSASKSTLKEQKDNLRSQQKAELDALRSQKDYVTNRSKGGTAAINREIDDLKRKQKAQLADLDAQNKYADGVKGSNKSIVDEATVGIDAYIRKLKEQDDALQNFQANLIKIAGKYGLTVATQLQKLGPDAAGLIQEFANATGPKAEAARKEIERNLDLTQNAANIETAMNLAAVAASKGADAIGSGAVKALQGHTTELLQVADQYKIDLTTVADPVLDALGLRKVDVKNFMGPVAGDIRNKTVVVPKADGGFDRGEPAIAPGGANVIWWAEGETGGESYIPHAPSKRARSVGILAQTADLFGLDLVDPRNGGHARKFADGGILSTKLPFPPRVGTYPAAYEAQAVMDGLYTAIAGKINQLGSSTAAPGGGPIGTGWQSVVAFLSGQKVPFTVTSTTGGGHAKNSLHYLGKAVDLVSGNMMQIYNALFSVGKNLKELIYSPAGVGIKNGQPVDIKTFYGEQVYKQHFNHVHAGTYDNGGWIQPGRTMVVNNSGRPEPVFTADQWDVIKRSLTQGGGGDIINHIYATAESTTEIARKVVRKSKKVGA